MQFWGRAGHFSREAISLMWFYYWVSHSLGPRMLRAIHIALVNWQKNMYEFTSSCIYIWVISCINGMKSVQMEFSYAIWIWMVSYSWQPAFSAPKYHGIWLEAHAHTSVMLKLQFGKTSALPNKMLIFPLFTDDENEMSN